MVQKNHQTRPLYGHKERFIGIQIAKVGRAKWPKASRFYMTSVGWGSELTPAVKVDGNYVRSPVGSGWCGPGGGGGGWGTFLEDWGWSLLNRNPLRDLLFSKRKPLGLFPWQQSFCLGQCHQHEGGALDLTVVDIIIKNLLSFPLEICHNNLFRQEIGITFY